MIGATMNKDLLNHWIQNDLAVANMGDGAWGWKEKAHLQYHELTLELLSGILYGNFPPKYMIKTLNEEGFDKFGYIKKGEKK